MNILFLVNTPRHFINTLIIIEQFKNIKPYFIIENNFTGAEHIYHFLNEQFTQSSLLLHGKNDRTKHHPVKQSLLKKREFSIQKKQINRFLQNKQVTQLCAASTHRIIFQYLYHALSQNHLAPECFYLDDGSASYIDKTKSASRLSIIGKKIRYGSWYQHYVDIGCGQHIDGGYVYQPDLIKSCLQDKKIYKISISTIPNSLKAYHQFIQLDTQALGKIKIMIVIDHYGYGNNQNDHLRIYLLNLVKQLSTLIGKDVIAIKTHPRDQQTNLDPFEPYSLILSNAIAFESILTQLPASTLVISGASTSSMDAKLLRNLSVISYIELTAEQEKLIALYLSLGIDSCSTFESFQAKMNAILEEYTLNAQPSS